MPEILQYSFFQNAVLSSILAGILCGFIGTYIVTRRLVFIAGGLAHASLGGVGICALLSLDPTIGATSFSLLSAYGIKKAGQSNSQKQDSVIAMLWAFGMSIGIICVYLSPSFLPDLPNYIFGNILLSTSSDILFLGTLTIITAIFFIRHMRHITAIAFDRDFALSMRLPVNLYESILLALTALAIVAILRAMGIVLAISLLSIPHITASIFAKDFSHIIKYSIGITITECMAGLIVSYQLNVPSGASIVFVSVLIYMLCRTIKNFSQRFNQKTHHV